MSAARLLEYDRNSYGGGHLDGIPVHMAGTAELIDEAKAGGMFVLVDDECRENEGDLVIPAQFATPDAINFMARYAFLSKRGKVSPPESLPMIAHTQSQWRSIRTHSPPILFHPATFSRLWRGTEAP
jgi:hypothetical protein